ncbi:MAG: tricarballylate utilization 4Fe-4S protein TcuB [Curvibacter sp.]|nr:MAG: tricarballylate utilization 4Fe-4S protein TcuB [Curvibacter sp.]
MQSIDELTRQARALANGEPTPAEAEVARQMQICNACRYCEGFCAVFPAMTRRLSFEPVDVHFLANLCHNCGACLHACQYAPPHEFAVNVPQAMAVVRGQTYVDYAWPPALGRLYQRNGVTLAIALALGLALFMALALAAQGTLWQVPLRGFYDVFPHNLLVSLFAPVFCFAVLALGLGVRRFLRELRPGTSDAPASVGPGLEAAQQALTLRYLDGGHGDGCHNEDDAHTHWRRRFHHLTFYGFVACFAATSVATLYHYGLGQAAPYGGFSLPKLFGVSGGLALLAGTTGLGWLRLRRHPLHGDVAQKPMDMAFIALLWLVAFTGLSLLPARGTQALPSVLVLHLGAVMALFATLPYGKFAHGVFRSAALLRNAVEKRQPNRLQLGSD